MSQRLKNIFCLTRSLTCAALTAIILVGILAVLGGCLSPAKAAALETLGKFGDWTAYQSDEGGKKLCFMSAAPAKSEGKYKKRGKIYAMVTHRPTENSRDVFSFVSGYGYNSGAEVIVTIDGEKFALAGNGETAWTPSDELDHKLTAALAKGSNLIVEGSSARGTKTKDTFSLKGSGDAYAAINKACPAQ